MFNGKGVAQRGNIMRLLTSASMLLVFQFFVDCQVCSRASIRCTPRTSRIRLSLATSAARHCKHCKQSVRLLSTDDGYEDMLTAYTVFKNYYAVFTVINIYFQKLFSPCTSQHVYAKQGMSYRKSFDIKNEKLMEKAWVNPFQNMWKFILSY